MGIGKRGKWRSLLHIKSLKEEPDAPSIFSGAPECIATIGFALAADLTPPPPPVFTWTGVYIGGQIGYAWGSANLSYSGFDPFSGNPNGAIGGARVGVNYQINQCVVGLEGSVDGTTLNNTAVAFFSDGSIITANKTVDVEGSIRGRLGVAWDRALIYATGGVALGGFTTNYNVYNSSVLGAFYASNSFSNTRVGWTVGGGIDYAATNNWSLFVEYRYSNWGTLSTSGLASVASATTPLLAGIYSNASRALNQNQVQVGFNYKFDMFGPPAPPVVAKQ